MLPAESWDMIRARQRRATLIRAREKIMDKRERIYESFGAFLADFVRDLDDLSEAGWALLVEGPRDARAMRRLRYEGQLVTVGALGRRGVGALEGVRKVVIMTELDREGATLAARFVKSLTHEGVKTSLSERRRLKAASRGVFLHIENLSRFGEPEV
jgi:5S rRNA maturation endonuclease (ribonuclease M5)